MPCIDDPGRCSVHSGHMFFTKIICVTAAGWELFRYALLYVVFAVPPGAALNPSSYLTLLWISAPQLVMVPAFLFIGLYPARYGRYLDLLKLGKLLGLFTGVLPILAGGGGSILQRLLQPARNPELALGILILVVDFILLIFLISLKETPED